MQNKASRHKRGKSTGVSQKVPRPRQIVGRCASPNFRLRMSTPLGCATWHPRLAQPNIPGMRNPRPSPSPSKGARSSALMLFCPITQIYQENESLSVKCKVPRLHNACAAVFKSQNEWSFRVQSGKGLPRNLELHSIPTGTRANCKSNSQKVPCSKFPCLTCNLPLATSPKKRVQAEARRMQTAAPLGCLSVSPRGNARPVHCR